MPNRAGGSKGREATTCPARRDDDDHHINITEKVVIAMGHMVDVMTPFASFNALSSFSEL
jgi:hypothetical protein